jgi:hypothetical protein
LSIMVCGIFNLLKKSEVAQPAGPAPTITIADFESLI